MSTEVRVYDMEDGHPCVVMVVSGTHDVSRLAGLFASGRCEDLATADYIRRTLRRHRGGRAALKLLREHGGPDLLEDAAAPVEKPSDFRCGCHDHRAHYGDSGSTTLRAQCDARAVVFAGSDGKFPICESCKSCDPARAEGFRPQVVPARPTVRQS